MVTRSYHRTLCKDGDTLNDRILFFGERGTIEINTLLKTFESKDTFPLAIEPMINQGTHRIKQLNDGWTILTADGKASAHFEHNVALIDGKPELLSTFQYIYAALGIESEEEDALRKEPLVL